MDIHNENLIPEHMMKALRRYIDDRIPPGGFLTAILCNDLRGAIGRADNTNIKIIPNYISFLYNQAPMDCWGSEEKFEKYLKGGE